MAGVWLLAETHELMLELLNIGRELADQLGTKITAFSWDSKGKAQEYITSGADEVLVLPPLQEDQPLSDYIPVIEAEVSKEDPDIFLIAGTLRGKEIAARLAARLNTGLCSDAITLKLDEENKLVFDRMIFGGRAIQTLVCTTRPQIATIPPRTFTVALPQEGREGEIKELSAPPASGVKVIERKPKARESGNIEGAKVIVCIGRGIDKEEDIALARDLAEALGGELACTRPIAEEMNWLPEETYIGLSGKKVKPDLYIGIGISGQIQHTIGIRDSRVICAINRDENAPIFQIADYGIVGDLYEVVPKLTQELKKVLNK